MKNHRLKHEGFTLIEPLIVVAIIGILAAIAIPNFLEAQTRAKVARVVSDMRTILVANEAYYVDYNRYLPSIATPIVYSNHAVVYVKDSAGYGEVSFPLNYSLTTPVSYLSSYPVDTFNASTPQLNDWSSWFGYYYQDPERGMTNLPEGENWYKLSSVGPDQIWGMSTMEPQLAYDPTNGTISAGDIRRFGGQIGKVMDAVQTGG